MVEAANIVSEATNGKGIGGRDSIKNCVCVCFFVRTQWELDGDYTLKPVGI